MSVKFLSCGAYLPENVLTNEDLAKMVDTTDEWIFQRVGIKERHIARGDELVSDMASAALLKALHNGNINPDEIDLLILATSTADYSIPSAACIVQKKVGLQNAVVFDIQAACSGFVYALTVADKFIKSGSHKKVAVIGADKMSSVVDWTDRSTCVIFGDGAGAVILEQSDDSNSDILDSVIHSSGDFYDILYTSNGVVQMMGKELFKHAIIKMSDSILTILERNKLAIDDIKLIVPHQANYRIISAVADRLKIDEEKFVCTISHHGNTSAASIPLALSVAIEEGKVNRGDLIIFESMGAGLTWGGVLVRW